MGRSQTTFIRRRGVDSSKMLTFCHRSWGRKCQQRGVGGQKKPKKLVNVVCECPLISSIFCKRKLEKEAFFDDKSAFICWIKNWFVPNRFDLELRSWKIQFWILHSRSAKPRSKCERKKLVSFPSPTVGATTTSRWGVGNGWGRGRGGGVYVLPPDFVPPSHDFWPPRYNSPPPRFSDLPTSLRSRWGDSTFVKCWSW